MSIENAIPLLKTLLGSRFSEGKSIKQAHSRDEAYSQPALPDAVVFPETTKEVSDIVKICAEHKIPIIPFGVGTSLEGHVIPVYGGISVDTSLMNKVLDIHESDLDVVVQAGVTREQLNEELRATGLMFTVDPGANATLGGMAATRASGTNTVRYGTIRENILAMEVVLPDGSVIETGSRARKSAAGYDLTHFFIGSEGTLGIITKLTVRLHGTPESILSATCACDSVDDAVNTVIRAIQVGIPMARIELLDSLQIKAMNNYNPDQSLPIKPHLFLEFHGSQNSVEEQVELFKEISEEFSVSDFKWATNTEDRNKLWKARHQAYFAAKSLRQGCEVLVTDCCVPLSSLAACIAKAQKYISNSGLLAPIVGHVGDGNFHLLILIDPEKDEELERAQKLAGDVNDIALSFGGTVTGEHGVGLGKKAYLIKEHGAAYDVMARLKLAIDPDNIMNPGKTIMVER